MARFAKLSAGLSAGLLAKLLAIFILFLPGASALARDGWLAWQPAGEAATMKRLEGAAPPPAEVALGSTWKLFVFAYLSGTQANETPYRCDVGRRPRAPGDEYCCDPGASVDRNTALVRSCGNYFEPSRLHLNAADWQRYWQALDAPIWLQNLASLQPDSRVPIVQLLAGLRAIAEPERQSARLALAPLSLGSANGAVLSAWGSGTRFKTFSWQHPLKKGASLGGAAGWLADGTPFWLGGEGVSQAVLGRLALPAGSALPRPDRIPLSGPCVEVDFLSRYPIDEVFDHETRTAVADGVLTRRYRVMLENGRTMTLNAAPVAGEIRLERRTEHQASSRRPVLVGRFTLNEYVGRVIDREADAQHTQAAQALAVAVRTYLIQNASFEAGCYRIADDSRTQRVSLNPASRSARAAALATDTLILDGATVRYHRDRASPGVLSWQAALQQGSRGKSYTEILGESWPQANLALLDASSQCRPVPGAQVYIALATPRWRRLLAGEPGFEMPESISICELDFGNPYADVRQSRMYIRQWRTHEARLTLAHEFIHLAFARHPNGSDEQYAERWARILVNSIQETRYRPAAYQDSPHLSGSGR